MKPHPVIVSRRLWATVALSLDQQETPRTADTCDDALHVSRSGVGVGILAADSLQAEQLLKRALKAAPAALSFVFVRKPRNVTKLRKLTKASD